MLLCYFVEGPSIGVCLVFPHGFTGIMVLEEENHSSNMPFLLYYLKVTCCHHDLSLMMTVAKAGFANLHHKVTFSFFPQLLFGGKSLSIDDS